MIKMIVFDIDNTLAMPGKAVHELVRNYLLHLENTGIKIGLISEKPTSYVSGFSRQLGLKDPVIIGEEGAQISFGGNFPPKDMITVPVSEEEQSYLEILVESLEEKFGEHIWIQPSIVNITVYFKNDEVRNDVEFKLNDFLAKYPLKGYRVFKTRETITLSHPKAQRGIAVSALMQGYGLSKEEIVVVGSGPNDVSMFKVTDLSIGIKRNDTKYNFSHITKVMDFLDLYMTRMKNGTEDDEEELFL